jgi:hypothetical protein
LGTLQNSPVRFIRRASGFQETLRAPSGGLPADWGIDSLIPPKRLPEQYWIRWVSGAVWTIVPGSLRKNMPNQPSDLPIADCWS